MSIKLQVANFTGDKNEVVAWVAAVEGKMPGMKKAKVAMADGAIKWVPACAPETILAILDADNADEIRTVCQEAIRLATPRKTEAKQTDEVKYFYIKGGALQLDSNNAPRLLSAAEVVAAEEDGSLFCKVGSQQWATAKDLGLVAPAVPPMPASVPAPPPMPTVVKTETMAPPAPVSQPTTAMSAMQRIEEAKARVLSSKRAS